MFTLAIIVVYFIAALGFLTLIQIENAKLDLPFNFSQVLVAIFWLPWLLWYIGFAISEWFKARKLKR